VLALLRMLCGHRAGLVHAARGAVTGAFPAVSPHVIGISFDESRAFRAAAAPGTSLDLQTIALHEIGYALGLDHSAMGGVMRADIAAVAMRAPAAEDAVAVRA